MVITKAIIPVAGWGARRLPITKTIEKSMLPIGNRPLVDYIVRDCVVAGITDIFFVVGQSDSQLRHYYGRNVDLEAYLTERHNQDLLELVRPPQVTFHYVVQQKSDGYGTAVPVALCASELLPQERVVVLVGDDFMYAPGRANQVEQLLQDEPIDGSVMLGMEVPRQQVSRYGVISFDKHGQFTGILEKPRPEQAPSRLINVSKYVMDYSLIQEVVAYTRQKVDGEFLITEPINMYVQRGGSMKVVKAEGTYLDGGTLDGWLEANRVVASSPTNYFDDEPI